MKKITSKGIALLLALTLCASLAACSSDDSSSVSESTDTSSESTTSESTTTEVSIFGAVADFDYLNFTYTEGLTDAGLWEGVTATEYVTLPEDFANVTVPTEDVTPSDESIQSQIDEILAAYTTTEYITERAAEEGDIANIDYSGSVGGVLFTGGTYAGHDLTLGSDSFIDGFEEQIVGHEVGETFDVVVTFPADYSDTTDAEGNTIVLSGAEATFEVTINSLSTTVTPELTDDWVYENLYASNGYATANELTQDITSELFEQNINLYVWTYLTENAEVSSVPAVIINYAVCQFLCYYDYQAYIYQNYYDGDDLESFVVNMVGLENVDALLIYMEDDIYAYAELYLTQQAVAEQLGLTVTDEVLEGYADYLESNPTSYVALNALATLVDDALIGGVMLS